jgi:outer membrane protein assembly factor BamD
MRAIHFVAILTVFALGAACGSSPDVPDGAGPLEVGDLAEAAQDSGRHMEAAEYWEYLYEEFPESPRASEAQWLAAENFYRAGELDDARKLYEKFFKSHPLTQLGLIGERMYDIGIRLYDEGKSGLLGLSIFTTSENGIRALQWITQNLPNGSRADDSFFFVGRVRMEQRNYDMAILNFTEILTRYPQSEWIHEARYLRGVAHLMMNLSPRYDRESLLKARRDLVAYLREVERNEALRTEYADRIVGAKERLAEVEERLARKSLQIAEFYFSQERWVGAKVYADQAATEFPNTEAAKDAIEFVKTLPKDVE